MEIFDSYLEPWINTVACDGNNVTPPYRRFDNLYKSCFGRDHYQTVIMNQYSMNQGEIDEIFLCLEVKGKPYLISISSSVLVPDVSPKQKKSWKNCTTVNSIKKGAPDLMRF